ncbi:hypothetical protein IIA79_04480 [bacterium]|nr:hypothetical protein [bacterium]
MRGFKTFTAVEINRSQGTTGQPAWQEGYQDRVIRSEAELEKFRYYIETNPLR